MPGKTVQDQEIVRGQLPSDDEPPQDLGREGEILVFEERAIFSFPRTSPNN